MLLLCACEPTNLLPPNKHKRKKNTHQKHTHQKHPQAQLQQQQGGSDSGSTGSKTKVVEDVLLLTNKAGRPKGMAVVRLASVELCERALGGSAFFFFFFYVWFTYIYVGV